MKKVILCLIMLLGMSVATGSDVVEWGSKKWLCYFNIDVSGEALGLSSYMSGSGGMECRLNTRDESRLEERKITIKLRGSALRIDRVYINTRLRGKAIKLKNPDDIFGSYSLDPLSGPTTKAKKGWGKSFYVHFGNDDYTSWFHSMTIE